MKSKEEIHRRTPLSLTSTDNNILRIRAVGGEPTTEVLVRGPKRVDGELYTVTVGEEYRSIQKGCNPGKNNTWCRLGKDETILLPNSIYDKIYGYWLYELESTEFEDQV